MLVLPCVLPSLARSQPSLLSTLMSIQLWGEAGQLPHLIAMSLLLKKKKTALDSSAS